MHARPGAMSREEYAQQLIRLSFVDDASQACGGDRYSRFTRLFARRKEMQKRYECPLPLGISRRSRLSNITVVGLIVAALAVSASPPGLSANDTDHQRRFMAVEQRLKVLEGERSELKKQITALESEFGELRRDIEKLVRESGKFSGPAS